MSEVVSVRFQAALGLVLRAGSVTSTALLALGLLTVVLTQNAAISTPVINLGLIVLMATPVARVLVSVVQYVANRDWLFSVLTLTVLLVLLGSLFVAFRG